MANSIIVYEPPKQRGEFEPPGPYEPPVVLWKIPNVTKAFAAGYVNAFGLGKNKLRKNGRF